MVSQTGPTSSLMFTESMIAIPRRIGSSPTDVTSFHPGQQHWTKHSMPDILYQLGPTAEWHVFRASRLPPQKVDANGDLVFEAYPEGNGAPRPLLGFKVLPDKVCSLHFTRSRNPKLMPPRLGQTKSGGILRLFGG